MSQLEKLSIATINKLVGKAVVRGKVNRKLVPLFRRGGQLKLDGTSSGYPRKRTQREFYEDFWMCVEPQSNGCWYHIARKYFGPYAHCQGNPSGERLVHRCAWESFASLPEGRSKHICHTCDNPRCCRPDHLFLGTPFENQYDSKRKGRNHIKLDWERVNEIRALRLSEKIRIKKLAALFNISYKNTYRIIHNTIWKDSTYIYVSNRSIQRKQTSANQP